MPVIGCWSKEWRRLGFDDALYTRAGATIIQSQMMSVQGEMIVKVKERLRLSIRACANCCCLRIFISPDNELTGSCWIMTKA
jgi:NAD/NADP transhydrogenase alpha subunit